MLILGLSGLPRAQDEYLRETGVAGGLDARICQGLDSAAAIVRGNGHIIAAAAEERFTGVKGTGAFPSAAIKYCLDEAGVGPQDVDAVAHGFDYRSRRPATLSETGYQRVYAPETLTSELSKAGWEGVEDRFWPVRHHVAHAASAFYVSGFKEALCLVSDGMGETESLTVFKGGEAGFTRLHQYSIRNSLGILYGVCTRFLGFAFNQDEYKVMGLAAYGDPRKYRTFFHELVRFDERNGALNIGWPSDAFRETAGGYPQLRNFIGTATGVRAREYNEKLLSSHADFAAGLQERLSDVVVELARYWCHTTGMRDICAAGGTFLNCVANEALEERSGAKRVFIAPASGDDGTAVGSALELARVLTGTTPAQPGLFSPYLGPAFGEAAVQKALMDAGSEITWRYCGIDTQYLRDAACDLVEDKIIGWFHGRMEFGPRALGNRSILALPNGTNIKERLNSLVKHREAFRPFAPSLLVEDAPAALDREISSNLHFMLLATPVSGAARAWLGDAVHGDGTARVQVLGDENPLFRRLLEEVRVGTGHSAVINTSLNVRGQPLIMAPAEAVGLLANTSLDRLYIEGFKAEKRTESD